MSNKLKEALEGAVATLEEICDAFRNGTGGPRMWKVDDVIKKAKATLAEPPRNCDVGDAVEQGERLMAQFDEWKRRFEGDKVIVAVMKWAQMPYEKDCEVK